MIARLADRLVGSQLKNKRIPEADAAIYRYGYILMMETMINILISVFIGIVFHALREVIWFLLIFVPLRSYAGGYHMDRAWKCIIATNVMIAGVTLTAVYALHTVPLLVWFAAEAVSCIVICALAPIDTKAKPLDDGEKKVYRRKTWLICGAEALIHTALLLLGMERPACVGIMAHAALVVSLTLEKWNKG